MSWIRGIDEPEAEGELKEIFRKLRGSRGKLSNIMKVQSLNPAAMAAHLEFYLAVMFQSSGLKRFEREMIAVVVSRANHCNYCVNHHAEALNFYWKDAEKVKRFSENFHSIELVQRHQKMLAYSEDLTLAPQNMEQSMIRELRQVGFSDKDILDINLITGYFNFVNRLANGLGVEFTAEELSGYDY